MGMLKRQIDAVPTKRRLLLSSLNKMIIFILQQLLLESFDGNYREQEKFGAIHVGNVEEIECRPTFRRFLDKNHSEMNNDKNNLAPFKFWSNLLDFRIWNIFNI